MSTAPTPGPTAPQPDRPIDTRLEDGVFAVHVRNAQTDLRAVQQWRDEMETVINTIDVGAAAGRSPEMEMHGRNDIERIADIAGMIGALATWIRVHPGTFSNDWNTDGPNSMPASNALDEIVHQLTQAVADMDAHGCWAASRDGQPSVMTRARALRAVLQQFVNLPVIGNSAASVQILTGVFQAVDEVRNGMEAEYNRRPAAPSAEGSRPLTGAVAQRYLGVRANAVRALNILARREFWEEQGLSLEATTVAQMARQLATDIETRIQLVPGAAADTVRVTDPNVLLTAFNRLVDRMERECQMRRPEHARMRQGTPEHELYVTNERWRKIQSGIRWAIGILLLAGGTVGTYVYTNSGKAVKEEDGKAVATSAIKPAPAPTSVLKLPQGCTVERKGNRLTVVVPAGNGAANVFVSQNGSPSQKVGNQLEAGEHSLFLPAGMAQNVPLKVTVQIWDGDKWLPDHAVVVP